MLPSLCCRRQGVSMIPGECPESQYVNLTSSSRLHFWLSYLLLPKPNHEDYCLSAVLFWGQYFPMWTTFWTSTSTIATMRTMLGEIYQLQILLGCKYWLERLKFSYYVVGLACFHHTQNRIGKSRGSVYREQVQRWRERKLAGPSESHGFGEPWILTLEFMDRHGRINKYY